MKDIWGKDHSGLVLKEIAVSVSDSFFLLHSFVCFLSFFCFVEEDGWLMGSLSICVWQWGLNLVCITRLATPARTLLTCLKTRYRNDYKLKDDHH